jgi:hypothetical protein
MHEAGSAEYGASETKIVAKSTEKYKEQNYLPSTVNFVSCSLMNNFL